MQSDQELFILLFASSGVTEKLIHSMEQELSGEIKDRTRILEGFIILCVIINYVISLIWNHGKAYWDNSKNESSGFESILRSHMISVITSTKSLPTNITEPKTSSIENLTKIINSVTLLMATVEHYTVADPNKEIYLRKKVSTLKRQRYAHVEGWEELRKGAWNQAREIGVQFSESAELGERLSGEGNNEGINFAVSNQKTNQLEERLLSAVGCQTTSAVSRSKVHL